MTGVRAGVRDRAGLAIRKGRTVLVLILVAGVLFFGSILFILSRAPHV